MVHAKVMGRSGVAFAGKDSRAKQQLSAILHEGWRAALPPVKLSK